MKQFARLLEQHPVFRQLTDAIKTDRTPVTMSGMESAIRAIFLQLWPIVWNGRFC